jgi:protoheme IX farnesyltransferase
MKSGDMSLVETPEDLRAREAAAGGSVRDYVMLLKPRVMSLVVFTALVGMVMAPVHPSPVIAFASLLAIAVGAGASGALNMWYDADIDVKMRRTMTRPVAAGRVTREEALGFGVTLSIGSVAFLWLVANPLAAMLLAFTIFFYAVVYTMWLKRSTPQNIVIGGLAGALPPLIGWAAMTGGIAVPPVVLVLIIFLWTPPHFWALSLYRSDDYARAGVPMLPVVAGAAATRRSILIYSAALVVAAMFPPILGFAGVGYAIVAGLGGAAFIILAQRIFMIGDGPGSERAARDLFSFSLLYLFLLCAALLAESMGAL